MQKKGLLLLRCSSCTRGLGSSKQRDGDTAANLAHCDKLDVQFVPLNETQHKNAAFNTKEQLKLLPHAKRRAAAASPRENSLDPEHTAVPPDLWTL